MLSVIYMMFLISFRRPHDTQHNDTQHNNTQHDGSVGMLIVIYMMSAEWHLLNVVMLSVVVPFHQWQARIGVPSADGSPSK
jgi:hypothetical protein